MDFPIAAHKVFFPRSLALLFSIGVHVALSWLLYGVFVGSESVTPLPASNLSVELVNRVSKSLQTTSITPSTEPAKTKPIKTKHSEPIEERSTLSESELLNQVTEPAKTPSQEQDVQSTSINQSDQPPAKVGMAFRPALKAQMEKTEELRKKWEDDRDPLLVQGDRLIWRKNGCFEITDNENGHGQTFQFSSRCPSRSFLNMKELIQAIKPTYE